MIIAILRCLLNSPNNPKTETEYGLFIFLKYKISEQENKIKIKKTKKSIFSLILDHIPLNTLPCNYCLFVPLLQDQLQEEEDDVV